MAVTYKKLFHLLIDKGMTNAEPMEQAGFSANMITRIMTIIFLSIVLRKFAKLYNVALMIFWSSPQRKKNEGCYSRCTLEVSYSYRN